MKRYLNHLLTLIFATFIALNVNSQCIATSQFGGGAFGPCQALVTFSTCNFAGEFAPITGGLVAGQQYTFNATGGTGNYITITTVANVVLAFGPAPLVWTSTINGAARFHLHQDAACTTDFNCHTTTGICNTCPPAAVQTCPMATPFAGGIALAGGTANITGNTACSGTQAVALCGTTLNTAPGVWYSFTTLQCAGTAELNTCTGTTFDSKLGVFRGSCAAPICVVGNDDACGLQSRVTWAALPNTTYYIYVTGFGAATGAFNLQLNFAVDPCCSAPPLTATFSPADITVCPYEPFSSVLTVTGGIPGPANGIATGWQSSPIPGAAAGQIARTNGNNGSFNSALGNVGNAVFRGGGSVLTNAPSTAPPVATDPLYYVSTPNFYRWQNGVETIISANLPANAACNAWDKTTNTMYFATAGFPGTLYTLNVTTGALTNIGNFNGGGVAGFAIWIVMSDAGQMYMFDIGNGNVYAVNKANAACTLLGPAGFTANFGQDAYFWNGAIYSHSFNSGTFTTQYRRFNITTGASTLITDFGFAQIGMEGWNGQTFPGGYATNWNMQTGLTITPGAQLGITNIDGVLTVPGLYGYIVTVTDACGNTTTARLNVTVRNIPDAMSCNDHVNISVDQNCAINLRADMFLEGPYDGCYDLMDVFVWPFGQEAISTPNVNNTTVNFANLFGTHTFVVENPNTGNRCWGTFTVEDKLAPVVVCADVTINCLETPRLYLPLTDPNFVGLPTVLDNCGNAARNNLKYSDIELGDVCNKAIIRRWGTVDQAGNISNQCNQTIFITPLTFGQIFIPNLLVEVDCNTNTDPASLVAATGDIRDGYAYIISGTNFIPVDGTVCNILGTYTDTEINVCGNHCHGNKKVIRTWQFIDWCAGGVSLPVTQLIKAADRLAPTFIVKDTIVTTSPWYCAADFDLPRPWEMHDNCDFSPTYRVSGPGIVTISGNPTGNPAQSYRATGAPKGVHVFCYTASDCCGNVATQCINVTVVDKTPPVVTTKQNIVLGLVPGGPGQDGNAKLFTHHIDNGSYDMCSGVRLEIRRPAGSPKCNNEGNIINPATGERYNNNVTFNNNVPRLHADDNVNDTDNGEFVKFCCADLTTGVDTDGDGNVNIGYHEVILRVWDDGDMNGIYGTIGDNYNETWGYVKVEDKAAPVIQCPPNATVHCDWAITLSGDLGAGAQFIDGVDFTKTGLPTAYGTCGALPIRFRDNAQLNQCGIGTVTRDFFVGTAPVNSAPSCRQTITVAPSTSGQQWVVTPPSSAKVDVSCDGPTETQIRNNKPSWLAGPCDVIGYSYDVEEFLFEDGVCKKWRVTYNLMNWCTDEARGPFFKDFVYKDLVDPVIENCEPLMFGVDANCQHRLVLTNRATDTGGCIETGWLKWQVFIDLWADGTNDWEFSSFLPVGNDVANAANGNLAAIQDNNGNGVPDIYVAPTINGGTISITVPEIIVGKMSNHKIVWKVTDGCHNYKTCHQDVMVVDKKAPTPYCVSLSTALMEDPDGSGPLRPMVELWARDFNVGSLDNCTPQADLLYTFDSWAPQVEDKVVAGRLMNIDLPHYFNATGGVMAYPTTNAGILNQYNNGELQLWIPSQKSSAKVWTDAVLPAGENKAVVDVMMSVWDKKFNVDFCWVTLSIICNSPGCGGTSGSRVSGITATEAGQGVTGVTVSLDKNAPEFPKPALSGVNGLYSFADVENGNYTLTASKGGDYMNGVSTFDLVLIQRHILGLQYLDSPYKHIAADVNNNGKIDPSDLVELRRLILGVDTKFTNNSWRFPATSSIIDITNVFPYNEVINANVTADKDNQNFVAVKIGDVNGSAEADVQNATAEARTASRIDLIAAEQSVAAGETVEVEVKSSNFNEVFGYQFTMNLNGANFVDVKAGAIDVTAENVGVLASDMITMSFASLEAATVSEDATLFTIVLRANKAGQLSEIMNINSNVTRAESYAGAGMKVNGIALTVGSKDAVAQIELFQNEPNPFKGITKVNFNMPKADQAVLTVYDVTGRVVAVRNINGVQGMNTETFSSDQLSATGVLYYKLESGDFTATKKMIIIE